MLDIIKNFKFNFRYIMALMSLVSCASILWLLAYKTLPDGNKDLFNVLATLFFNNTISKAMRALFPDKEDIKKI